MNHEPSPKVGLVLSGGGAKGAYQVGVIKALAELQIPVELVAGASIGALNGAMVSASRDLGLAAERLEELWTELGRSPPLQGNWGHLRFLAAWGATWGARLTPLAMAASLASGALNKFSSAAGQETGAMLTAPIRKILDDNLGPGAINAGLDLYVSVFPAKDILLDGLEWALSAFGIRENRNSEFIRVQDLEPSQQHDAILASAALPLVFEAQEVAGKHYRDGGMGGNMSCQGNTPAGALVKAGCTHLIVTHLSDGSLWSRAEFPDTTIVEIRPLKPIASKRLVQPLDVVDFDPELIRTRIQQGYDDTVSSIAPIREALRVRGLRKESAEMRDRSVDSAVSAAKKLDDDEFSRRFA